MLVRPQPSAPPEHILRLHHEYERSCQQIESDEPHFGRIGRYTTVQIVSFSHIANRQRSSDANIALNANSAFSSTNSRSNRSTGAARSCDSAISATPSDRATKRLRSVPGNANTDSATRVGLPRKKRQFCRRRQSSKAGFCCSCWSGARRPRE